MPLRNQRPPTEFNTVGPFDNTRDYDTNDRVSHNGMSYVAPEPIPAGEGAPNPGTNRWIDDPGSEGTMGDDGRKGNDFVRVYIRSAAQPTTPTFPLSGGWQETIPTGTDTLWAADGVRDNASNTITFQTPQEWRGPVGPTPTDAHLRTVIDPLITQAIANNNLQNATQVLQSIIDYLSNNGYLIESRIQDLINNTLTSLIATDGLIDVEYSTDQVDWRDELASYRYVRLRGSNTNAPWHILDFGIVAAQGGTATMLGVEFQYSIDGITWTDMRHADSNWFRMRVGLGAWSAQLPLPEGGGSGTNLTVENVNSTSLDIASSTGTDATVPSATQADAGLMDAADKTKLDSIQAGAHVNIATDLSVENRTGTTLDIASSTGTDATVPSASQSDAGLQSAADKTKLDSIQGGAHVNIDTDLSIGNQTATTLDIESSTGTDATVPSATQSDAGLQSAADKTKLDGIETGATADQTAAEIKAAYESNPDTNEFSDAEQTKLAGIEAGAQVNVDTDLAIANRDADSIDVTSSTGTNATLPSASTTEAGLSSATDKAKLDGIEANATADQTDAEIKTAYENNANTNAFTDAEQTKLGGIATGAEVNEDTDLSIANRTGTSLDVESSTGTNATIPSADTTEAGLQSATDKTKLDALDTARQMPSGGTMGQVLKKDSSTDYDTSWQDDTTGAGGTDLSVGTRTGTTLEILSNTGADATVPSADTTEAGLQSAADKTKLDGIEANATADQTASEIKTAYESNPNTNAFDDTEQTKLAGIETGAQVNVGTDLSIGTHTGTSVEIDSSTGADAVIPAATTSEAGVMSSTDKTKVDALGTNRQIPSGGDTGQVLKKDSPTDYDVSWQADSGGGGGGASDADSLTVDNTNFDGIIPNTVTNAQEAFDAIDDSVINSNNVGQVIATLTLSGAITQTQSHALGGWVLDANAPAGFSVVDAGTVTDGAVQLSQTKVSDHHDGYWVRVASGTATNFTHDFAFDVGAGNNSAVGGNVALNTLDLLIDAHAGDTDTVSVISQTTQSPTLGQTITITLYLKVSAPAVVARNGNTDLGIGRQTGTELEITSSTGNNATLRGATTSDAGLQTAQDKTKLDGVEAGAEANVDTDLSLANRDADSLDIVSSTGANVEVPSATPTAAGLESAADKAKLDGIEANATADQTDAEIKTAYESNPDTNEFSDAEQTKLAGIATGAEVNVDTDLSIANRDGDSIDVASSTGTSAVLPSATTTQAGLQSATDKTKLDGIDAGAEVNVGTDLSVTNRDADSLDIASSTGANVEVPSATDTAAGLESAADKAKLDTLSTNRQLPSGGTNGQILQKDSGTDFDVSWQDNAGSGGTGATNLSVENRNANTLDIASDTGTDATVPASTTTEAGLQTGADKTKLDALATDRQIPAGGTTGQVIKKSSGVDYDIEWDDDAGGAGSTDLSVTNRTATALDIASSTGTDATVPEASTTEAGLLNATDKTKVNALAANRQIPTGGTMGQVLRKDTATDFDVSWQDGATGTSLSDYNAATTYSAGQMAWFDDSNSFTGVIISRQDNNVGNTPVVRERTAWWDILSGSDISQIEEFFAAEERLPDATTAWRLQAGTTAGVDGVIEANPTSRWYDSIANIPEDRQHLTKWRVLIHAKNYGQIISSETPTPVIDPSELAQSQANTETSFPVEPFDIENFENYAGYAFTRSIDGTENVNLVDLSFVDSSGTVLAADQLYQSNDRGRLDLNEIAAQASRLRLANSTTGRISVQVTGVYAEIMGTITHNPTKMAVTGGGHLEVAFSQSHTHIAWTTLDANNEPGVRMMGGTVVLTEATVSNTSTQAMIVVGRLEPSTGTTPNLAAGDPTHYPAVFARDAHGVRFQSVPYSYPIPTTDFDSTIDVSDVFILGYTQDNLTVDTAKWQFFANNTLYRTASAGVQVTSPIEVSGSSADLWYILWTDTLSTEAKDNFSTEIIKEPYGDGLYGAVDRKAVIHPESATGPQGRPGLHAVAKTESFTFTTSMATDARGECHWINDTMIGNFNAFVQATDFDYWAGLEDGDLLTGWIDDDNYCQVEITTRLSTDSGTGEVEYEFAVLDLQGRVNGRAGETIELRSGKPEQGDQGIQGIAGRIGRPSVYVTVSRTQSPDDTPNAGQVRVQAPTNNTGNLILNTTGTGFETDYLSNVPIGTGVIVERIGASGTLWIGAVAGDPTTSGDLITFDIEWKSRTGTDTQSLGDNNNYDVSFGHTPSGGTGTQGELGYSANAFSATRTITTAADPTAGQVRLHTAGNLNVITFLRSDFSVDELEYLDSIRPQTPINLYTADFSKRLNAVLNLVTETPGSPLKQFHYTAITDGTKGTLVAGDTVNVVFGGRGLVSLVRDFTFNVANQTDLDAIPTTGNARIAFATISDDFGTYRKHDLLFHAGTDWERIYRFWQEWSEEGTGNWRNTRANNENWSRFVINGLPTTPFTFNATQRLLSGPLNNSPVTPRFTVTRTALSHDWRTRASWDFQNNPHFDTDRNTFTTDGQSGEITTDSLVSGHNLVIVENTGTAQITMTRIDVFLRRYAQGSNTPASELSIANDTTSTDIAAGAIASVRVGANQAGTLSFASTDTVRIEIVPTFQADTDDWRVPTADFQYTFSGRYHALPPYLYLDDHIQRFHDPNLPAGEQEVEVIDYFRKRVLLSSDGLVGTIRNVPEVTTAIDFSTLGEWNRVIEWGDLPDTFSIEENTIVSNTGEAEFHFGIIASATSNLRGYNSGAAEYTLTELLIVANKFASDADPDSDTATETLELAHLSTSQEVFSAGAAADIPMTTTVGQRVMTLEEGEQIRITVTPTPANDDFLIGGVSLLIPYSVEVNDLPAAEIDIEGDLLRAKDETVDDDPYPIANLNTQRSLLYTEPPAIVYYVQGQVRRTNINHLSTSTTSTSVDTDNGSVIPFNDPANELIFEPDEASIEQVHEDDVLENVDGQRDNDFNGDGDNTGVFEFADGHYNVEAQFDLKVDNAGIHEVVFKESTHNDVPVGNHTWVDLQHGPDGRYYCLEHTSGSNTTRVFIYGENVTEGRTDHYITAHSVHVDNNDVPYGLAVTDNRMWVVVQRLGGGGTHAYSFALDGTRHSGEDRQITTQVGQPRAATYDADYNKIIVLHADAEETGRLVFFSDDFRHELQSVHLPSTEAATRFWRGVSGFDGYLVSIDSGGAGGTVRAFEYPSGSTTHLTEITTAPQRFATRALNYLGMTERNNDDSLMLLASTGREIASYRHGQRNQHDVVLARSTTFNDDNTTDYKTHAVNHQYFKPRDGHQYYFAVNGVTSGDSFQVQGHTIFKKIG